MAYVSSVPPTRSDPPGLGPKKTFFVLVTVVGCIAILWPKVFQPMFMGAGQGGRSLMDDHRGSGIRQERPPHIRPDAIHPAMRERGRAIPSTQTIPIVDRNTPTGIPGSSRVVDGRPRPMPNLPRPPMGAGSIHQATGQKSTNTMGFVMPLYTIGIVSFFIYTLMKIVMKKSNNSSPYPIPQKEDPNFRNVVFEQQEYAGYKRPSDSGSSKLGWKEHEAKFNETKHPPASSITNLSFMEKEKEDVMEITLLRKKLQETESTMANIIAELGKVASKKEGNQNSTDVYQRHGQIKPAVEETLSNGQVNQAEKFEEKSTKHKKRDLSSERATVKVLGMEMTASCQGGQKWSGRPPTPVFSSQFHPHSPPSEDAEESPEPQSIFLQGALPHESQILVADSAVTEENIETDDEENGAIVLSSKMTLSLISLDPPEDKDKSESDVDDKENLKPERETTGKVNEKPTNEKE
ncbi:resistance to inhibitors of cholinesterase protein 3 isoform X5 [Lutzomyia longipalpis]|uniref:resistance to inhibitors of cholinesterase protein 3 isoform X5 n=1 Tax=Lutzomyia longipalpis TaxID=7200 RepID=UPI0024842204|nr:resistance to inhibitors of cholinesterase protein 3 isoform X5 [Lutzomyia longipalpis]XP_055687870.1 resistance to inhibitors of cholinesterase protein 3 isoform X5 [Lutzomyia longipalpis]